MGKHCLYVPCYPSIQDPQLGTPYPRSAGFDTDIGAFIESSLWDRQRLMARLVIGDGIRTRDVFVPSQLFAFGSIVLHANSTGHLVRSTSSLLSRKSGSAT